MPDCSLCEQNIRLKYQKENNGVVYSIFNCFYCGLWQIYPIPQLNDLEALYKKDYFEVRTDRGYNDYLSAPIKKSILNTLEKNLTKLNFFSWEKNLFQKNRSCRSLDIGCAAGYFVEYLQERGWYSEGIDIAGEMVDSARARGLKVQNNDFLKEDYPKHSFELITLWASLEHLPNPEDFIQKFYQLLKPGGHIYISTCHLGFWACIRKDQWRFLNVPEHIWFFSHRSLQMIFKKYHFHLNQAFTYGSGFTAKKNASYFYRLIKSIADRTAQYFFWGDMIVCDFIKK